MKFPQISANATGNKIQEINKMKNNLNNIVNNLSKEYNTRHDILNQQQNIGDKLILYISLHNERLKDQIGELTQTENKTTTRDALIRNNNIEYMKKKQQIKVLQIFFSLMLISVLFLVAFLGEFLTLANYLTITLIMVFGFVAYYTWEYNIFELRTTAKTIHETGKHLEDDYKNYVRDNCDCTGIPEEDIAEVGKNKNKVNGGGDRGTRRPLEEAEREAGKVKDLQPGDLGYYYYDGSAPEQKIYPESENKIAWSAGPDMGSRYTDRYTPDPNMKGGIYMSDKDSGLPLPRKLYEADKCNIE